MLIRVSAVILSLIAATSVCAAPTPAHLEKQDTILNHLKDVITEALRDLGCDACVAALVAAKDAAHQNKDWVLKAANGLCRELKLMDADVCQGLVYSQGSVFIDAILRAKLLSGDGKMICYQILGACPAPAITSGAVKFPKPKPVNANIPAPSGRRIDVLHLSDWHVDDQYTPGSEGACNKPLCCRKYADSPVTPTLAASTWGEYNCDSPVKLGEDLLEFVPSVAKPKFAIMTGDVPPHDVWLGNKSSVLPQEEKAYDVMASGFSGKIYPTVGNHEAGPTNLFPTPRTGGDNSWLYASLADNWSRWLPSDAVDSVKDYGAYAASPRKGLRIISLNTNFCYKLNFYLYGNTRDYDPFGELKWLINQLQAAEDTGERAWIIGHVGPSQIDCLQNWSAQYYQVIQRYSPHVIAEQFFGHAHYDEFSVYYQSGIKDAQNAISTAWTGPSVTPYTNINPGFRVYKVDTGNWNVYDSLTYIADLSQAATWDATGVTPNWHLEYSARQVYGTYVPIAADAPLSASWWHNVTTVFQSNNTAFQQYWTYRGKSANRMAACVPGSGCPEEMICKLRAGNSSDECSTASFGIKHDDHEGETMDWKATDSTELHSLYRRTAPKPWNKSLCGLTSHI
ncbi:Metallo-dependent phosphatase-like protein [Gamsiella multidivaricata]|uniref:Metallo-dependent phosphatase-like protein n=1 Tax=Gamsiella multidivaricata TaxID=101098 RepID=UPI00222114CE|nr:Metallo-dependent phosphatase-like protein [Gamsiella multidivaricata]KAG0362703.1 hypothetical protein BGZ54_008518 [Gamsiella multidivaricata]KAI7829685.1 Metallo-dependent phosphatase-like protein [Gamsiella multidivaricata]